VNKPRLSPAEARSRYGKQRILVRDGRQMMVLRPGDPALALQLAQLALQNKDGDLFARIPEQVENYTFVGWLPVTRPDVPPGYVVDEDGFIIDDVKPGDSFVTLQDPVTVRSGGGS